MKNKQCAFISGHGDVTESEFGLHYVQQLMGAVSMGVRDFVVGDFRGADLLAQNWLYNYISYNGPDSLNVVVYHMFGAPRHNPHNFPTMGGFKDDESRDAAMTKASTYDIAWVREGKKNSGTEINIRRRNK